MIFSCIGMILWIMLLTHDWLIIKIGPLRKNDTFAIDWSMHPVIFYYLSLSGSVGAGLWKRGTHWGSGQTITWLTQRQTTILIHIHEQFEIASSPNLYVSQLWEETRAQGPSRHRKNKQTLHKKRV